MMEYGILFTGVALLMGGVAVLIKVLRSPQKAEESEWEDVQLMFGFTCPHCKKPVDLGGLFLTPKKG